MAVGIARFLRLVDALPEAEHKVSAQYTGFSVG